MDLDATTRKQCHAVLKDVVAEVEKAAKKEAWLSAWFARERFEVPLRFSHQELPSVDVDVNDLRQRIIKYCPRRMWLQWNGDAEGECYAPFLCVHLYSGLSFETFARLLGSDLGQRMRRLLTLRRRPSTPPSPLTRLALWRAPRAATRFR
jgi:hypothetical protein